MRNRIPATVAKLSILILILSLPGLSRLEFKLWPSATRPDLRNIDICNQGKSGIAVMGVRFRPKFRIIGNQASNSPENGYYSTSHFTQDSLYHIYQSTPLLFSQNMIAEGSDAPCVAPGAWIAGGNATVQVAPGQSIDSVDKVQFLTKEGSCLKKTPRSDEKGITVADVKTLIADPEFYNPGKCIPMQIGKNGGKRSGGWVDNFLGQTQLNYTIPQDSFYFSQDWYKWAPHKFPVMYMLGMSTVQEIFNYQSLLMIAIGGKETFLGMEYWDVPLGGLNPGDTRYQEGFGYGPLEIIASTFSLMIQDFPRFFPEYACASGYKSPYQAGIDAKCWKDPLNFDQSTGHRWIPAEKYSSWDLENPGMVSGIIASSLYIDWMHMTFELGTNMCYQEALEFGKDTLIALKMLPYLYNQGHTVHFPELETMDITRMEDVSSVFRGGQEGYTDAIMSIMTTLIKASQASEACGGPNRVYDRAIDLHTLQLYLFGKEEDKPSQLYPARGNGYFFTGGPGVALGEEGTVHQQRQGGLLAHFPLTTEERIQLWDNVQAAFALMKGRAPSGFGPEAISFRYDWLTMLRIIKYSISREWPINQEYPTGYDFNFTVAARSNRPEKKCNPLRDTTRQVEDLTHPWINILSPAEGQVVDKQLDVVLTAFDKNLPGLPIQNLVVQYSFDSTWDRWTVGDSIAGSDEEYRFTLDCGMPGYPRKGETTTLFVKVKDYCTNCTIQGVKITGGKNCADPVILPGLLTAGMYDDDTDGIGDRITAAYAMEDSLFQPRQVSYRWPASAAEMAIPGNEAVQGFNGKELVLRGKFSTEVLTAGEGRFATVFPAGGRDSTMVVPLRDFIAPIIRSAVIALGVTEDTLRIGFSEPVNTAGIRVPAGELFRFKRNADAEPERIDPVTLSWNAEGTEAILTFANAASSVPRSGDLVRIEGGPGHIADLAGNTPGPGSRYRVIRGPRRSEIRTVTYREIALNPLFQHEPVLVASLQPVTAGVKEVVESTGRMGHLLMLDLAGHATKDDFTQVDPSQVFLEYQAAYFTNLGVPVVSGKRTIGCTDALFKHNCLDHRGHVFVGWNYTAGNGRTVGTGAYVATFRFQVKVAGKVMENGKLDQVWGVLRRQ